MTSSKDDLKRVLRIEGQKQQLTSLQRVSGFFGLSEPKIIWHYQSWLNKYEYHFNSNHLLRSMVYQILVDDNVCIGVGTIVTRDIKNNCKVAGVPAKVINHRGPLDWS